MISMSITLVVLFFVLLGALFGLAKGFKKSVLRLITVAVSAIVSYFIAVPITKLFVTKNNIYSLAVGFGFEEGYNELVAISPATEELVCALAVSLIATIVFILVFFIIKALTFIPYVILSRKLKIFKDEEGKIKKEKFTIKLIGFPIGALQGLLSMLVILVVLAGFFNVADNVIDTMLEDNSGNLSSMQSDLETIDDIMDVVKNDPIMSVLCYNDEDVYSNSTASRSHYNVQLSAKPIVYGKNNFVFEGLTKVRYKGQRLSLTKESVVITQTFIKVMPLIEGADEGFFSKEIKSLEDLVDVFSQSGILTEVGAELIAGACEKWSNGEEFVGIAFEGIDENVDPIILALFDTMKDSTAETLKEDLHSFVEIISVFDKYELFASLDDSLIRNISGDFISEILTALSTNERFNVIIPEVTNLSIRMIANALNITDVSELLLEPGHYELSEEDIQNLCAGFDHILRFIDSLDTLEGDSVSFDRLNAIDITAMGQALDVFKNTSLFGNAVDPIAGAVVSGVTGSASENITNALKDGDVSYESLLDTVQSTANVINNMQKEEATVEEKQQAIVELFENITPENADVIVSVIDEDFVVQMGATPEYAETFAEVLSVSLKEMANLDEEEHEAEAEKVKYIFDIVSNSDKNTYGEDGVFESVEDIITVAIDSKVAGAVLMELTYDENGNEVSDALGIASSISEEDKAYILGEVLNYCNEKKETESPEEYERINQMTNAICLLILGEK